MRKFICIQELYHYRDDKQSVTAEVWHATKINMKYDNRLRLTLTPTHLRHKTMDKPTNQSPINEDSLCFDADPAHNLVYMQYNVISEDL